MRGVSWLNVEDNLGIVFRDGVEERNNLGRERVHAWKPLGFVEAGCLGGSRECVGSCERLAGLCHENPLVEP